ncbi:MAG: exodeoxyribonuclease VII large subunit [Betaproteobacteria bacterium]|nr:exodeoxyribonuclease VII large subunit [Betaproteobacteria bacterium]NCA16311.1 exodeoxyribonuclease VII large subunit [Betaproteobacteria bacterium]
MWKSHSLKAKEAASLEVDVQPLLTVSGLNRLVNQALTRQFPLIRLAAEISQANMAESGHWYLTLKDKQASVRAVMFRREASALTFRPAEGLAVEVRASTGLYEARGEFQIQLLSMQVAGQGSLYDLFLRLKARLTEQGLFDASRKKVRPERLARVGLVTSYSGAALRDFLVTLERRAPRLRVVLFPSLVQGAEAPTALLGALERAARTPLDALAIVRGGGSLEDLWAFNDEAVVRAVAASPHYTVSGVGHETDTTLCDLAADHRAATPTGAAEWLAEPDQVLHARLAQRGLDLRQSVLAFIRQASQRLDYARRSLPNPRARLASHRSLLERALERYPSIGRSLIQRFDARLDRLRSRLEALSPLAVLARGYVLALNVDSRPLTAVRELAPGDRVQMVFADGVASARVEAVSQDPGAHADAQS